MLTKGWGCMSPYPPPQAEFDPSQSHATIAYQSPQLAAASRRPTIVTVLPIIAIVLSSVRLLCIPTVAVMLLMEIVLFS